jgi:L-rhamnose isomerase
VNRKQEIFAAAKEIYENFDVDVEDAMSALDKVQLGIHAWQGDDVCGFEKDSFTLTGYRKLSGACAECRRTPKRS